MISLLCRSFGRDITNKQNNLQNIQIKQKKLSPKYDAAEFYITRHNEEVFCVEYIDDIISNYFETEQRLSDLSKPVITTTTFKTQRWMLIDWICCIHTELNLDDITLHLTINIIDRYLRLCSGNLDLSHLAKIGLSALWISIKYHRLRNLRPISIQDIITVTGEKLTKKSLIKMELCILEKIGWNLTVPTSLNFVQCFYQIAAHYIDKKAINKKQEKLQKNILKSFMMYCSEICLIDYNLSLELPSKIASAIFYYSCIGTKIFTAKQIENNKIKKYIGNYSMKDIINIVKRIHQIATISQQYQHSKIFKKYSDKKYYQLQNYQIYLNECYNFGFISVNRITS